MSIPTAKITDSSMLLKNKPIITPPKAQSIDMRIYFEKVIFDRLVLSISSEVILLNEIVLALNKKIKRDKCRNP